MEGRGQGRWEEKRKVRWEAGRKGRMEVEISRYTGEGDKGEGDEDGGEVYAGESGLVWGKWKVYVER